MNRLYFFATLLLIGCGGEWGGGEVGRVSCSFGSFSWDFLPIKMAVGSNGKELYILDDFSYVHSYKRDNLGDCAFNLEDSYKFSGFPKDVFFAGNGFYVQDGTVLRSKEDEKLCDVKKNGFFAVNGGELAVGDKFGMEIWNISNCSKKISITSQSVLALAANGEYYVAESQNLAMYSKGGQLIYREPFSSIQGNEKNFSADRIVVNDYGVYLLDKKSKKIGVFDNQAVWRKTISLDSLGIRNPLDIGAGEYSYIFILRSNGVEKVNIF